ncbi:TonB-dependent receptor [Catenovulum adriaticum]|uniref:TonB-dependent receptor n=1 Tax=Catenovulum adriaticum TaxID=2984846 RepID=A0ABY7ASL0_9ALTE|nr:TonB-dependent receptor [Catenovulum sp. TS8]WAJ72257.1 TonB-dependent receptor [Catenovulum sp. TS8]
MNHIKKLSTQNAGSRSVLKKTLLASMLSTLLLPSYTMAAESEDADSIETITVSGIAESYRNAINEKRAAPTIVDALSSSDIGALPDLSVAETLERITGVTGDRFKGNASEISIRGLGPFLGFSTVNGRAISSGSGNRSVAFSQFPSELVNGVTVYKAQTADLLEGGVSGLIDLGTIRPLDYGKERLQAEIKLAYNPYQAKFDGDDGIGQRSSLSYTNTFETDNLGEVGFAIGYAGRRTSSPEESYNTSSTLRNCNSDYLLDGGSNCSFEGGADGNAAANGGEAIDGDYYFIPNSFYYRQMESKEKRDAAIFALQWQPNEDVDVNIDGQWSDRNYFEDRHDLYFDDGRRRIHDWETNDDHILTSYSGESRISSYGEYRVRDEEYKGLGANVEWQVNDNFKLIADAAYSGTERWQTRTYARFRSDRLFYQWQAGNGDDFATVSNVYTDNDDPTGSSIDWLSEIQDLSFFGANSEARSYRFDIKDSINSYKLDGIYTFDEGFFSSVKMGLASSSHKHLNYQEESQSFATPSENNDAVVAQLKSDCQVDWPQSDYGDDANSPVSTWAQFDTKCAHALILGDNQLDPSPKDPTSGDIDLVEDVTSVYAVGNFVTEVGDKFLTGNIGLRYVTTDVTSQGISTGYNVVTGNNGAIDLVSNGDVEYTTFKNSYSNLLPSLNLSLELSDDLILRGAVFAGISRPDMWYLGAGRDIGINNSDEDFTTVEDAIENQVTARGNPNLEAIESNNYDLNLSWYYESDTMLSAALYYKTFNAKFGTTSADEDIRIDGQTYTTTVQGIPEVQDEDSSIKGIELTAMHKFNSLPAPFDGLGISTTYNYADSDFETPEAGGSITQEARDMVEPGNLAGLSKHNFTNQVYWESDDISIRLSYKYRSEYLKPFGANLAQTNRFVDDTQSVDLSTSYKIHKNFKLKFQALNLTNESYVEQRVASESYNRIEYSGVKYYVGLQYRM